MHHAGALAGVPSNLGVYAGHADRHSRFPLVDRAAGSVHQVVAVAELEAGGGVELHAHAYEEAIYVLEGDVAIELPGGTETLAADDFCFIEKGVPHSLENPGGEATRWLELAAPQPGGGMIEDTVFGVGEPIELPESPFVRGHFDPSQLPAPSSTIGLAGFGSANVGGAGLKIVVDREFGASQFNLMVVEYAPGGFITEHDHAFEEAFFFLSGEIEALLDGETHRLDAGDYCWSGVRSPHAFTNRSDRPVRWLETQVPQPPVRHQARFKADWDRLLATPV